MKYLTTDPLPIQMYVSAAYNMRSTIRILGIFWPPLWYRSPLFFGVTVFTRTTSESDSRNYCHLQDSCPSGPFWGNLDRFFDQKLHQIHLDGCLFCFSCILLLLLVSDRMCIDRKQVPIHLNMCLKSLCEAPHEFFQPALNHMMTGRWKFETNDFTRGNNRPWCYPTPSI